MKTAILLPLLVLARVAVAEGRSPKPSPRPTTNHTATNHTATNHTATNHTMPIKAGKGVPIGTIGRGRPRAESAAAKQPFHVDSAQAMISSEDESCKSIGLKQFCTGNTQANCCEYLDDDDNWVGCEIASNLYTCTDQFEDKPLTVCCS